LFFLVFNHDHNNLFIGQTTSPPKNLYEQKSDRFCPSRESNKKSVKPLVNLSELLDEKHKHYKIVKRGHVEHLIKDHTHLTNEKLYAREHEKNYNQKTNGWKFQQLHNHMHIVSNPNESFLDESNYLLLEAYYLIASIQKEILSGAILFHITSLWAATTNGTI
jgi:hypothetical protein